MARWYLAVPIGVFSFIDATAAIHLQCTIIQAVMSTSFPQIHQSMPPGSNTRFNTALNTLVTWKSVWCRMNLCSSRGAAHAAVRSSGVAFICDSATSASPGAASVSAAAALCGKGVQKCSGATVDSSLLVYAAAGCAVSAAPFDSICNAPSQTAVLWSHSPRACILLLELSSVGTEGIEQWPPMRDEIPEDIRQDYKTSSSRLQIVRACESCSRMIEREM